MAKSKAAASRAISPEDLVAEGQIERITLKPLNIQTVRFTMIGTAPYVQQRFCTKGPSAFPGWIAPGEAMKRAMTTKKNTAKKVERELRNFDAEFAAAAYRMQDGSYGIPLTQLKAAIISACVVCGFYKTAARRLIGFLPEGYDAEEDKPMIRIQPQEPKRHECAVRLEGVRRPIDIRVRPMWPAGWKASLAVEYDADLLTATDVGNLLYRAGRQIGIGEGRPDSVKGAGMGWGTFTLEGADS